MSRVLEERVALGHPCTGRLALPGAGGSWGPTLWQRTSSFMWFPFHEYKMCSPKTICKGCKKHTWGTSRSLVILTPPKESPSTSWHLLFCTHFNPVHADIYLYFIKTHTHFYILFTKNNTNVHYEKVFIHVNNRSFSFPLLWAVSSYPLLIYFWVNWTLTLDQLMRNFTSLLTTPYF